MKLISVGPTFLSAIVLLTPPSAGERPQPPRRWVLTETRTLEGVGKAQGAALHDGKLYVYGDAETGVIVEFTLDLQPTGRRLRLTRGGRDLISHPTGLTFHPVHGTFIGDSPWKKTRPAGSIASRTHAPGAAGAPRC